jgi:hypothetical protein
MESLSLQQILEITTKNRRNDSLIFILKKSPEITNYDKEGKLIINRVKGFIAPRLFLAKINGFIFNFQGIITSDEYNSPYNRRNPIYHKYTAKKFPEYFSNKVDEEGKELIGLITTKFGMLINNKFEFEDELIDKYLNISFKNEEEEDFFTYNFRRYFTVNPNDWTILKYDETKFEMYIQKLKQLGFENFSRYALDQGLNGDVISVIGSFLGPLELELGKQVNQDPLGVFQSRQPLLLEDLQNDNDNNNDNNNKIRKLKGGVKSKTRKRVQERKTFSFSKKRSINPKKN